MDFAKVADELSGEALAMLIAELSDEEGFSHSPQSAEVVLIAQETGERHLGKYFQSIVDSYRVAMDDRAGLD